MNELFDFLRNPVKWWKNRQAFKRRLAELRKRDPFIYK
jgi:hypothetical protein